MIQITRPVAPDFALRRGCLHAMYLQTCTSQEEGGMKGTKGKVQVASLRPLPPARESYPFQCSGLFSGKKKKNSASPK